MIRETLVNGEPVLDVRSPGRGTGVLSSAAGRGDRAGRVSRAPGTRVTLARMHSIQRINQALAQLVASLNVVAAVLIVLMTAAAGYTWAGLVGIIGVVGTVFAGVWSARATD